MSDTTEPTSAPEPSAPKSSSSKHSKLGSLAGTAVVLAVIWGFMAWSNGDSSAASESFGCDDLSSEAVRVSEDQDGFLTLLKVRNPKIVTDNRLTYTEPIGNGEALILKCRGAGVWSSGDTSPVIVTATVDSDGDQWVGYRPVGFGF